MSKHLLALNRLGFRFKHLLIAALSLSLTGCYKRYITTVIVCDKKLYLEIYEVNPAGMNANYLTDSVNFRTFIDRYDPAFQYYKCECLGDNVYIEQYALRNSYPNDTTSILVKKRILNLSGLIKEHKFD